MKTPKVEISSKKKDRQEKNNLRWFRRAERRLMAAARDSGSRAQLDPLPVLRENYEHLAGCLWLAHSAASSCAVLGVELCDHV